MWSKIDKASEGGGEKYFGPRGLYCERHERGCVCE